MFPKVYSGEEADGCARRPLLDPASMIWQPRMGVGYIVSNCRDDC